MRKYYIVIFCGLFIALQVVFRRVTAIDMGFVRVNLEFLPIALGGAIFGPMINGLVSAASDVVGFLLFPSQAAFFPGYTLSALLKGLAYGLFLKAPLPKRTRGVLIRAALAAFCVTIPIEALLNTLWYAMLYKEAYTIHLGTRLIKSFIMLPLHVLMFGAVWRPLGPYIERAVIPKITRKKA